MKPIEIFYHLFVPFNEKGLVWNIYFDDQIRLIKSSKLHEIAKFNLVLTAHLDKQEVNGWPITRNGTGDFISWGEKIQEYITMRYPWINIIEVRDICQLPDIYEGATLNHLWEKARARPDANYLYFHPKAISHNVSAPSRDNWREILDHFHITEWTKCITELDQADVIGVADAGTRPHNQVVSGNYFWARGDYLSSLPRPTDSQHYVPEPHLWPTGPSYRYAFERWILSGNPRICWIADTKTEHYGNYLFLESFLANNPAV